MVPSFDLHPALDVVNRVGLLHIQRDRFCQLTFFTHIVKADPRSATMVVESVQNVRTSVCFGTGHNSILSQRSHVGMSHVTTRGAHGVLPTSSEQVKWEMWDTEG